MKGDHDDGVIRDELLRQLREAFKDMVFKPPIRKNKMKGDQIVELTAEEIVVSEAMDTHMSNSNCCGTLDIEFIRSTPDIICQFVCRKCHEVTQIG